MHEMTLAQNLLKLVLTHPSVQGAGGGAVIEQVRVRVGRLAGVESGALRMGFSAVARGTPAQNAQLELEEVAPWAVCACGQAFAPQHLAAPCPACGGHRLAWKEGLELQLAGFNLRA